MLFCCIVNFSLYLLKSILDNHLTRENSPVRTVIIPIASTHLKHNGITMQLIHKQVFLSFEVCLDSDPITKIKKKTCVIHILAISSYKAELDNELMLLLKLQFEKQYTCTMLLVLLSMCPHKQHVTHQYIYLPNIVYLHFHSQV